jgi:signal transduction histidine kinase
VVVGVSIAGAIAGLRLVSLNDAWISSAFPEADVSSMTEQLPFVIAFSVFGVVGALIISRDRRNVIGMLLMYGSVTTVVAFVSAELVTTLVREGAGDGPLVTALALAGTIGWVVGILPGLIFVLLLFPTGRLPSPRWRPFAWFVASVAVLLLVTVVFGSARLTGSVEEIGVANPLRVRAVAEALGWLEDAGWLFLVAVTGGIAAVVVRYRRSEGVERQQIRWFAFAAAFLFLTTVVEEILLPIPADLEILAALVSAASFLALPVAIGIAVLRYRLYDLDVVIRKTIVFAALAVFATLVYAAIVVGAGAWLGRDNSFLTMIAAVVVAVTFQPVRGWLTRAANRIVYGRRATPYEVLSDFADRVGATYGDEDVLPRMAVVLGEGIGAERADVWLKVDEQLRDVAVWPDGVDRAPPVQLTDGVLPSIPGAERVLAVEHAGELLGALAVRKPASDPVSPSDEKLIADLAAQAGLVLRNVRLTEELRARLDDLRAAQKRLVAAQDEERRRLERNIHDGAQQQLVALAVKARLARSLADREPAKAAEMLGQIEAETQSTLEDLRDLARGIYPPLLADRGLVAALEAQARKAAVPVTVEASAVGRLPQEVEAAVYFCVLEALQNVAKYADAGRARVSVTRTDGVVRFEVADDGRGFDPSARPRGTGLQGIADRLGALDGSLEIRSGPGQGTMLTGTVPVEADVDATASPPERRGER